MIAQNKFTIRLPPEVFEAIHFVLQEKALQMRDTEGFGAYYNTANGGYAPAKEVYFRLTTKLCNASLKPKETTLTLNFEEATLFVEVINTMSIAEQGSLGIFTVNQTLLKQIS